VAQLFPTYPIEYARRNWRMFLSIQRGYVHERARTELGWQSCWDFGGVLARLQAGEEPYSPLARTVGIKGYHPYTFADGPYPVDRA